MSGIKRLWLLLSFLLLLVTDITYSQKRVEEKQPHFIDGYFLIYRKAMTTIDEDHLPSRLSHVMFFVKKLDDHIFNDFRNLDSLSAGIYDLYRNAVEPYWVVDRQKDSLQRVFSQADYYDRDVQSGLFRWDSIVPNNVINGNDRFLAVYKGRLNVIGPFPVISNVIRRNGNGFIYLKNTFNSVEYLYTVVLPALSTNRSNDLPLASDTGNKERLHMK